MDYLKNPLTESELFDKMNCSDNQITVIVRLDLADLIKRDIDSMNQYMDLLILPTNVDDILEDISYKIVGCEHATENHSGYVYLEVNARIEFMED